MKDSAHDKEHVYRVLYTALAIAKKEGKADVDVLIASCLLHDIGRQEQFADPKICHARAGAKKAYDFLKENGFSDEFSKKVSQCILTHRYRRSNLPESLEAKILFDADKIDVAGAVGIARTLVCWMGRRKNLLLFSRNTNISWRESIPVFSRSKAARSQ